MSTIEDYIKDIEALLGLLPFKLSTRVEAENRGDIALYMRVEIVFIDESELHVREYLAALPEFTKIAYSYHYQSREKDLIFRYDNAEHHPEISTYPHHKHLKNSLMDSREITLRVVIDEVLHLLFKGKAT